MSYSTQIPIQKTLTWKKLKVHISELNIQLPHLTFNFQIKMFILLGLLSNSYSFTLYLNNKTYNELMTFQKNTYFITDKPNMNTQS